MNTQATSDTPREIQKTPAEALANVPVVAPRVDVFENADEVLVLADVPGIDKESLVVRLENETLHVEAKARVEKTSGALYREFREVSYERSFRVPLGIDTAAIDAELSHGVVRIRLPKTEQRKPKQIKVKFGSA
ncbi:MAG: Hsp20/alpha crystallin family protein [Polyangiaceae bacterium]